MQHFTQEENIRPSEKTLNFIRQIAYAYNTMKRYGQCPTYCLN